jgi:uncharacterized protein (TIGR03067 family)
MNRRVLCGLLLSLAAAGCFAREARVDPDIPPGAALSGQWTPVSAQMGGKDFPVANFAGASLHMTERTYEFAGDQGTYEVVSVAPPARMDIHGERGPNAGKLIPAVYQVNGDQLDISYQLGPGVRPHDFTSPAGSQILLIHYRRTH